MATVRVTNNADHDLKLEYDRELYLLESHKPTFVPEEAAHNWFGNPNALNTSRVQTRTEEFNRLRVLYGAYDDDEIWERNKPNVTVKDFDDKDVTTVIDDPTGETVNPRPAVKSDVAVLEAELQRQNEMLKRLEEELSIRRGADKSVSVDDLPKDTPDRAGGPPRPRQTPPKAARE